MYHLINLENQTRKSFETRIDLLAHWRFQLRHDSRFSSINSALELQQFECYREGCVRLGDQWPLASVFPGLG